MSKNLTPEQFIASGVNAMEHFQSIAASALDALESLATLNLSTVREGCDSAAANGRALLSAKTPQEVATLTVETVKPGAEKAAGYTKQVYEISNGAAQQISDLFKIQFEQLQNSINQAAEAMVKSSPFGSELGLVAMKEAQATAAKAVGNLNEAVKKAQSIAEENMAHVAKVAKPTARKAGK